MTDEKEDRYANLIECSARILAFDGIIDAGLPHLVNALIGEAVDLRNGWTEFSPDAEPGSADLPIVDAVIAEVSGRADALRRECDMRRAKERATDAVARMKLVDAKRATANEVAAYIRAQLAAMRKTRPRYASSALGGMADSNSFETADLEKRISIR